MSNKKKIDIQKVTIIERKILLLLERNGKYLYGNIFKELNLSQTAGAHAILSLITKGHIRNVGASSYYELCNELKEH